MGRVLGVRFGTVRDAAYCRLKESDESHLLRKTKDISNMLQIVLGQSRANGDSRT